ncbi:MAG: HD domain-containing protein [Methanomassiliicoccales archaeon]
MLTRDEALAEVRRHITKEGNIKHMIAVGAVMRQLAIHFGEDQDRWEIVGILHDIDLEKCHGMEDHTLVAKDLLCGKVDEEVVQAIMAHNAEATQVPVDTRLKKGLIASDASSGLVLACALVMPTKKLADVKKESLAKKFGNKDFAKGVSRERIMMCEQLGLARDDFLLISLEGMRFRAEELGL